MLLSLYVCVHNLKEDAKLLVRSLKSLIFLQPVLPVRRAHRPQPLQPVRELPPRQRRHHRGNTQTGKEESVPLLPDPDLRACMITTQVCTQGKW